VRSHLERILAKRVHEAINKVSHEYAYEVICTSVLHGMMLKITQEIAGIAHDLDLYEPINAAYEECGPGGKALVITYKGKTIGYALLTL